LGQNMKMNRIAALLLVVCTGALDAHPCPFDWNIEFAVDTEIKGDSINDFVAKFNEAAKKETKGKITKAIIYDQKPDTFRKVPEDSPFSKEMDTLFRRYGEVTAPLIKKGLHDYGTAPIAVTFPAKFPVACLLAAQFSGGATNYEEKKEGALVTRRREVLECRAYKVNVSFLEAAEEWHREDRIPAGMEVVSYVFAFFSGMTRSFYIPGVEQGPDGTLIVEGVTHYLPDKKVVLAIETKDKHEEMTKVMTERGYLAVAVQNGTDANKKDAQQVVPPNGP